MGTYECLQCLHDRESGDFSTCRCLCKRNSGDIISMKLTKLHWKPVREVEMKKLGFTVRSDALDSGSAGYAIGEFSISNTLELSYTEWCMSELAKALDKEEDQKKYLKLSKSYRNVYDPERVGLVQRMKMAPGRNGQKEDVWRNGMAQSNVIHTNRDGLCLTMYREWLTLMGGREKVLADLTNFLKKYLKT